MPPPGLPQLSVFPRSSLASDPQLDLAVRGMSGNAFVMNVAAEDVVPAEELPAKADASSTEVVQLVTGPLLVALLTPTACDANEECVRSFGAVCARILWFDTTLLPTNRSSAVFTVSTKDAWRSPCCCCVYGFALTRWLSLCAFHSVVLAPTAHCLLCTHLMWAWFVFPVAQLLWRRV